MILRFLFGITAFLVAVAAASYVAEHPPSFSSAHAVPSTLSPLTEADIDARIERKMNALLESKLPSLGLKLIEQQRERIAEISGWVFRDRFNDVYDEFRQLTRRNEDDLAGKPVALHTPPPVVRIEKPLVKYLPPDFKLEPKQKHEPKPKNKKEAKAAKQPPTPAEPKTKYLRAAPPLYHRDREGPYPGFTRDYPN